MSPTSRVLWLWGSLLVVPLAAFPASWGIGMLQAKNAVFIVAALAGLIWFVENWWLRGFFAWAVVSFAWAGGTAWAMAGLLGLFAWGFVYAEVTRLSWAQWAAIKWPVTAAALFQVGWMTMQAAGYDPLFVPVAEYGVPMPYAQPIVTGWFGNPMDAALFLGLSLPLVLRVHWSLGVIVSAAIVLWVRSVAGFVPMALAWTWWAGARHAIWTLPAGVAAWLFWATVLDLQSRVAAKFVVWTQAWQVALLSPWVGWGLNAVDYRVLFFQPDQQSRWNFVFNEWLQVTAETGFIGLGLVLGYSLMLAWRTWRTWPRPLGEVGAGALAVCVTSLFSIPFRIGPTALLAALYLGRLDVETRHA